MKKMVELMAKYWITTNVILMLVSGGLGYLAMKAYINYQRQEDIHRVMDVLEATYGWEEIED